MWRDVLFLRVVENVPIHGAEKAERQHEQQQFPMQHLVQASSPQEQQFSEPGAAGRWHFGLVADRHRDGCGRAEGMP